MGARSSKPGEVFALHYRPGAERILATKHPGSNHLRVTRMCCGGEQDGQRISQYSLAVSFRGATGGRRHVLSNPNGR